MEWQGLQQLTCMYGSAHTLLLVRLTWTCGFWISKPVAMSSSRQRSAAAMCVCCVIIMSRKPFARVSAFNLQLPASACGGENALNGNEDKPVASNLKKEVIRVPSGWAFKFTKGHHGWCFVVYFLTPCLFLPPRPRLKCFGWWKMENKCSVDSFPVPQGVLVFIS